MVFRLFFPYLFDRTRGDEKHDLVLLEAGTESDLALEPDVEFTLTIMYPNSLIFPQRTQFSENSQSRRQRAMKSDHAATQEH